MCGIRRFFWSCADRRFAGNFVGISSRFTTLDITLNELATKWISQHFEVLEYALGNECLLSHFLEAASSTNSVIRASRETWTVNPRGPPPALASIFSISWKNEPGSQRNPLLCFYDSIWFWYLFANSALQRSICQMLIDEISDGRFQLRDLSSNTKLWYLLVSSLSIFSWFSDALHLQAFSKHALECQQHLCDELRSHRSRETLLHVEYYISECWSAVCFSLPLNWAQRFITALISSPSRYRS